MKTCGEYSAHLVMGRSSYKKHFDTKRAGTPIPSHLLAWKTSRFCMPRQRTRASRGTTSTSMHTVRTFLVECALTFARHDLYFVCICVCCYGLPCTPADSASLSQHRGSSVWSPWCTACCGHGSSHIVCPPPGLWASSSAIAKCVYHYCVVFCVDGGMDLFHSTLLPRKCRSRLSSARHSFWSGCRFALSVYLCLCPQN